MAAACHRSRPPRCCSRRRHRRQSSRQSRRHHRRRRPSPCRRRRRRRRPPPPPPPLRSRSSTTLMHSYRRTTSLAEGARPASEFPRSTHRQAGPLPWRRCCRSGGRSTRRRQTVVRGAPRREAVCLAATTAWGVPPSPPNPATVRTVPGECHPPARRNPTPPLSPPHPPPPSPHQLMDVRSAGVGLLADWLADRLADRLADWPQQ